MTTGEMITRDLRQRNCREIAVSSCLSLLNTEDGQASAANPLELQVLNLKRAQQRMSLSPLG